VERIIESADSSTQEPTDAEAEQALSLLGLNGIVVRESKDYVARMTTANPQTPHDPRPPYCRTDT